MVMNSCVLFLNGNLGIRVLLHILESKKFDILAVVLNNPEKRNSLYLHKIKEIQESHRAEFKIIDFSLQNRNSLFETLETCDFGISALFGHKIPSSIINVFRLGIINLHPSLLPLGKGADPIPWGILLNYAQGATIHLITEAIDAGPILRQEKIHYNLSMSAGDIYEKCVESLYRQFTECLFPWLEGNLTPKKQKSEKEVDRKSVELENLRILSGEEIGSFDTFLRRIQALSFSDGRSPIYLDETGRRWEIQVRLSAID